MGDKSPKQKHKHKAQKTAHENAVRQAAIAKQALAKQAKAPPPDPMKADKP